jgi:hypothetical protein
MHQFPNIDTEDYLRRLKVGFLRIVRNLLRINKVPSDVLDFDATQQFVSGYIDKELRPDLTGSNVLNSSTLKYGYCAGLSFGNTKNLQAGIAQKLLGVYEVELTDRLEELNKNNYEWIVNIGAAEGLYSMQFAKTWKKIPVYSFEQDYSTRQLLRDVKRINKSDNVVVLGEFKTGYMSEFATGSRGLIFSDCEGFEKELFASDATPLLSNIDLVIETHDHLVANTHDALVNQLGSTHKVFQINQLTLQQRCSLVSDSSFRALSAKTQMKLLDENRHPSNRWLIALSSNN